MSEWWTYRLSDFLMFSPATYRRLFELYNTAIWPLQLATLAAGIALCAGLFARNALPGRTVGWGLAACWLWIAWAFHWERYAAINWAATGFAAAFAVEALLLVGFTLARNAPLTVVPRGRARGLALALMLVALAYPVIGVVAGRGVREAEVFGVAPDPTVVATLALLVLVRGRAGWVLRTIPLAWCLVEAATLWTLHADEAWLLVAAGAVALAATWGSREPSRR